MLDMLRMLLIVLGTGLIGSCIGYAKRYYRVQHMTGMGLSGAWPVILIMASYSALVVTAMSIHVYNFGKPGTPYLISNPLIFGAGIWASNAANKRMRELYPNG